MTHLKPPVSIEMGAAVPLPLKGARGVPAIEGADAPYEDWLCQYFYPLLNPPIKNEPPT